MTQKDFYDYREDENTRQVSLIQLLRCAFKRWKLILLAAVLLGGLLGSYKILSIHSKKKEMISAYDTYKNNLEIYKATVANYKKTIAELQANIDERLEYTQNAPKMQINPFYCAMATADVQISGTEDSPLSAEKLTMIMNELYNEIYYGDTPNIFGSRQNIKPAFLNELIVVRLGTNGTMRITLRAADEALAETLRDDLLAVIESRKSVLSKLGDFNIEIINKGTTSLYDADVQAYQEKQNDTITKLQSSLSTAQNQNAQLVKPVAVPQYSKKYMLINGIKLGIVGFAAGAVLAVFALIVWVLFKGAILSPEEIDGEYGLKKLADFSDKKPDDENELDYMMARIESCIAGKECQEIGIVGSISAKKLEKLAVKLSEKAHASKIRLKFTGIPDFSKKAGSYRKLRDMDGVILAEEIGKSDYIEVRKEIALIAENGNELIGTVYY